MSTSRTNAFRAALITLAACMIGALAAPAAQAAAPETTMTGGPPLSTNDTMPTFTFSSNAAGAAFTCRIDGSAPVTCESPFAVTRPVGPLADGGHTFSVAARAPWGETDPTPATERFVVDTFAPDTVITSGPGGSTSDNTPTFEFAGLETVRVPGLAAFAPNLNAIGYVCSIDDALPVPCGSPYTTAKLAQGRHAFRVAAVDAARNVDPTPAVTLFAVGVGL
jgi:hypothetical protein